MSDQLVLLSSDLHLYREVARRFMSRTPGLIVSLIQPGTESFPGPVSDDKATVFWDGRTVPDLILREYITNHEGHRIIPLWEKTASGPRLRSWEELIDAIFPSPPEGPPRLRETREILYEAEDRTNRKFVSRTAGNSCRGEGLTLILSLGEYRDAVSYVVAFLSDSFRAGRRVFRLSLTSGFFPPAVSKRRNDRRTPLTPGLSEILLKLEYSRLTPSDLLEFAQYDEENCLNFGGIARADDIVSAGRDVLFRFLTLLRRLCDDKENPTVAYVTLQGLPFSLLGGIISAASEIHILLPSEGQYDEGLKNTELNELLAGLPPSVGTYIHA